MGNGAAGIGGRHVTVEKLFQAGLLEKAVHEKKASQPFTLHRELAIAATGDLRAGHLVVIIDNSLGVKPQPMPSRRPAESVKGARERIARIRDAINTVDYLCSGTMLRRTKLCGSPTRPCASDPSASHGPYYKWGHMKGGRLVHRMVSPEQAAVLRRAVANYRRVKTLLWKWEAETERLIDLEHPRSE